MEQSQQNTRSLINICKEAPESQSCRSKIYDLLAFSDAMDKDRREGSTGNANASGFAVKQSGFEYDLLLAESLRSAVTGSKPANVAIEEFLVELAKKEGGVNAFLDAVGVVGGVAACSSGAGTALCVAGAIGAVASANHLYGDMQQAISGETAKTALVQTLVASGMTPEEAEKYQRFVDIGTVAVAVTYEGGRAIYRLSVNLSKLKTGEQAVAALNGMPLNEGASSIVAQDLLRNELAIRSGIPRNISQVAGSSFEDLATSYRLDGATVTRGTPTASSTAGIEILNIQNHKLVKQVEIHPGGGSHDSGKYYKFTYHDGTTVRVIDTSQRFIPGQIFDNQHYYDFAGNPITYVKGTPTVGEVPGTVAHWVIKENK
ncbi:hypothetical protein [Neorhizobium sp. JUb45]|uniref:hypothetical protein n=2 Tax=unclassified Neorhizobium TaxID=2629175 RepID=UPI001044B798|nr:hypothetical protein [Neorhizobium sp. JUb45]TCQ95032.1 hypothetical protein EDF70_1292 [Neorhizobium sp. JUb45]